MTCIVKKTSMLKSTYYFFKSQGKHRPKRSDYASKQKIYAKYMPVNKAD